MMAAISQSRSVRKRWVPSGTSTCKWYLPLVSSPWLIYELIRLEDAGHPCRPLPYLLYTCILTGVSDRVSGLLPSESLEAKTVSRWRALLRRRSESPWRGLSPTHPCRCEWIIVAGSDSPRGSWPGLAAVRSACCLRKAYCGSWWMRFNPDRHTAWSGWNCARRQHRAVRRKSILFLSALIPVLLTSHYPSAVTEPTRPTRVRSKSTWISRCFAALEYRPGQQKHSSDRHPCQPRWADAHRKRAARPQGLPIPPDLEGGTPPAGGEEETLETDRRDRHEADLARLLPR